MARPVTVILVLAVVACVFPAPSVSGPVGGGSATASDHSIGVGHIAGGNFGESSFSIGAGGKSTGQGNAGHGGNHDTNSYGAPGGESSHIRNS